MQINRFHSVDQTKQNVNTSTDKNQALKCNTDVCMAAILTSQKSVFQKFNFCHIALTMPWFCLSKQQLYATLNCKNVLVLYYMPSTKCYKKRKSSKYKTHLAWLLQ